MDNVLYLSDQYGPYTKDELHTVIESFQQLFHVVQNSGYELKQLHSEWNTSEAHGDDKHGPIMNGEF